MPAPRAVDNAEKQILRFAQDDTCETFFSKLLAGRPSAVDEQGVTGDERGGGGSEKDHGTGDFLGLADTVQGGNSFDGVGAEGRVGEGRFCSGRENEGRRYGVDSDVIFPPFDGKAFGKVGDAGLGHAIDGFGG